MKKVRVHYKGGGEDWPLGTLADDGQSLLFEYSDAALAQGLELSPRHLPLQRAAFGGFPAHLLRLPGLIADALPDGWGMLLMDRLFRKQGVNPAQCSPLDRLSFIGQRGMGALTFEPATQQDSLAESIDLHELAHQSALIYSGQESEALLQMALLGGSPQGARPKVLVYYDKATARISSAPFEAGSAWLVKFQAPGESPEVCAIEALYAQWAQYLRHIILIWGHTRPPLGLRVLMCQALCAYRFTHSLVCCMPISESLQQWTTPRCCAPHA